MARSARAHVLSDVVTDLALTPSPSAVLVAREIWLKAVGHARAPVAGFVIAEQVGDALRIGLTRWVGLNGSRALLDRAIRLVGERHPVLRRLRSLDHGAATETGQTPASARAVAAGMIALLAIVIELLSHLIGADIAESLVRQSAHPSPRGVAGQSNS